ncbi:Protein NRT1/PTR FAMILY 5.5 [Abeliophyllum distichum]|uniref:Protein NRT1/PTR FAMILY 5.5 n=1 Tax=Abeliophyllum distichum TaxID=126358 RepID=A0ABD1VAE9_9LAMI
MSSLEEELNQTRRKMQLVKDNEGQGSPHDLLGRIWSVYEIVHVSAPLEGFDFRQEKESKSAKKLSPELVVSGGCSEVTLEGTGGYLVNAEMATFVRILVLLWADILSGYTMWVMQTYLTNVWKLSFTHAAGILNIWGGAYHAYSVGMVFLSMSTPPVLASSTGTCKDYKPECIGDTQKALFYTALALLAVGIAGHRVSLKPFLEEQKSKSDDNDDKKVICQILCMFIVAFFPVIGGIALPYIKPWSIRFGVPAICTVVATLLFMSGSYSKSKPKGSPLTNVCRVFVASTSKISKPRPLDARELHKKEGTELQQFSRTRILRCLEKAAIILPDKSPAEQEKNRWRLCTVSEVEEAKIVVRMVPMWMTFIICGIVSSIGNTYFLEQANHMDRKLGKWKVPLPMLLLLFNCAKPVFAKSYTYLTSYFATCKKYAPPVGLAVAMVFSVLCCITAARIEIRRLKVIRRHDLLDKPKDDIPMSIFWLLFQFFLLAGLDSFFEMSSAAFFKDQAPKSMRNYLQYSTTGVSGLGFMGSVLSVYVVGKVSEKGGRQNWFQYTLNKSRLDRYYWVLAALGSVNLIVYIFIASSYRYKDPEPEQEQEAENGPLNGDSAQPGDEDEDGAQCPCCG